MRIAAACDCVADAPGGGGAACRGAATTVTPGGGGGADGSLSFALSSVITTMHATTAVSSQAQMTSAAIRMTLM